MKQIEPSELKDNFFQTIGKEWMLVTSGNSEKFNTMTASWGGIGWLWNKPVAFIFIRPERYTFGFIEQHDKLTLSFLGYSEEARNIYNFCGSKSGKDVDKIKETGLKPIVTESGLIAFEQARMTLECKKLYEDDMKAEAFLDQEMLSKWYGAKGNMHKIYVVEIEKVWINE